MTAQVLFLNVFPVKDPNLNTVEIHLGSSEIKNSEKYSKRLKQGLLKGSKKWIVWK